MICFGVGLDQDVRDPVALLTQVDEAESGGLDLVAFSDHPYLAEHAEAWAALAFVLGRSSRVSGLVDVTNLPLRPAPMLARTITTLTALSGERLVVGMGAGGYHDAIAGMGGPRRTPGESVAALAEAIEVVRLLSGGDGSSAPTAHAGPAYPFGALTPAPVAPAPIWTGANGPRGLRITGRLADGWVPGRSADWRSGQVRRGRQVIDDAASAAGRSPSEVVTAFNVTAAITSTPTRDSGHAGNRRWSGGSVEQWVAEIEFAVAERQAGAFVFFPSGPDPRRQRALWTHEVVPAARAALARSSQEQRPRRTVGG